MINVKKHLKGIQAEADARCKKSIFSKYNVFSKAGVPKSGIGTPSGVGMVNIWGHKLVMESLGSLRYYHDIGQRGPTTGPRNNFGTSLVDHKQRQPFFWRTL